MSLFCTVDIYSRTPPVSDPHSTGNRRDARVGNQQGLAMMPSVTEVLVPNVH